MFPCKVTLASPPECVTSADQAVYYATLFRPQTLVSPSDVRGSGIPVGMGIPWNPHGNGNEEQISVGMGMEIK